MSRRLLVVLGVMAVVVALAFTIVQRGGLAGLSSAAAPVDPSRVHPVERGPMVRSVVATGKIEPISKVEIKSKANGIIKALLADVDSVVAEGAVLAELDKDQLLAQVRGADANLQAASAALSAARAQLQKNRVEAEGPDVEFARKALQRAESLFAQRLLAQAALDDARSALEVAENRRHAAESQLAISAAKVAEADAQVAQAMAAADHARQDLANATIRSPIRGTVLTRDVEIGSPVSSILNLGAAATLVMTLGDVDQVFVRGKIDEADIGHVQTGQIARIKVETFRDRTFTGRVTRISPMGTEKDSVTSFEVRVSIDNPGKELKPNMTANAEIVLEEYPNCLLVPEAAVAYDAQKNTFVEIVAPDARSGRQRVPVKLGVGNGTNVQVLDGLKEGDRIILPS
jgi:HlyD family secretion protein